MRLLNLSDLITLEDGLPTQLDEDRAFSVINKIQENIENSEYLETYKEYVTPRYTFNGVYYSLDPESEHHVNETLTAGIYNVKIDCELSEAGKELYDDVKPIEYDLEILKPIIVKADEYIDTSFVDGYKIGYHTSVAVPYSKSGIIALVKEYLTANESKIESNEFARDAFNWQFYTVTLSPSKSEYNPGEIINVTVQPNKKSYTHMPKVMIEAAEYELEICQIFNYGAVFLTSDVGLFGTGSTPSTTMIYIPSSQASMSNAQNYISDHIQLRSSIADEWGAAVLKKIDSEGLDMGNLVDGSELTLTVNAENKINGKIFKEIVNKYTVSIDTSK